VKRHFWQWQRLNRVEKAIFVEAAFLLCLVRAALWIVPFSILRRFAERGALPPRPPSNARERERQACARAVHRLAHYVPRATCLTQSLAVFLLLKRRRDPVCLQIGVAKGDAGKLLAHAWVETPEGTRLTASGGSGFVPLVRF
jgi:hypothetical protein